MGEECAGVVKTATFDADQLVVKARQERARSRRCTVVVKKVSARLLARGMAPLRETR
jgi:hypothetical protein